MGRIQGAKVSQLILSEGYKGLTLSQVQVHEYMVKLQLGKAKDVTVERFLHLCVDDPGFDLISIPESLLLSPLP